MITKEIDCTSQDGPPAYVNYGLGGHKFNPFDFKTTCNQAKQ